MADKSEKSKVDNVKPGAATDQTQSSADDSAKTAYCKDCHRRHQIAKWPDGHTMGTADAATVSGADSPEDLGEQARERINKKKAKGKDREEERLSPAERAERRARSMRLGKRMATAPFNIGVIVTADRRWRTSLTDESVTDIAESFADFAEAFGIHTVSKVVAVTVLAMAYAEAGSDVYTSIKAQDAKDYIHGKPEDEEK